MIGYDKERKTYFVQYREKNPITGKVSQKKKRGFALKREAKAWEAKQLEESQGNGTGTTTFAEMTVQWERSMQSSPETIRHHREHFEYRFTDLKDKPISKITRADLMRWRADLAVDDRWSTGTKNITISYVKSVFAFASMMTGMADPAAGLSSLKKSNAEIMSEMQTWSPEEFDQFLGCVDSTLYRTYFETLYWTGMRRGEAIALQIQDVSTDGWINIHASQRTASEGLKPTKTKQSRKIQADPVLLDHLLKLKETFKHGYLFGGDTPLSPTTINRIFNNAIKQSGVRPIRIHDLRHSHATWLINNGVNIVAVSKRLGHSTIEQTLKTYTHLLQSTDEQMMATIAVARKSDKK